MLTSRMARSSASLSAISIAFCTRATGPATEQPKETSKSSKWRATNISSSTTSTRSPRFCPTRVSGMGSHTRSNRQLHRADDTLGGEGQLDRSVKLEGQAGFDELPSEAVMAVVLDRGAAGLRPSQPKRGALRRGRHIPAHAYA